MPKVRFVCIIIGKHSMPNFRIEERIKMKSKNFSAIYLTAVLVLSAFILLACNGSRETDGPEAPVLTATAIPELTPVFTSEPTPTPEPYSHVSVKSDAASAGTLVLVNWEHEYLYTSDTQTMLLPDVNEGIYLCESNTASLCEITAAALREFAAAFTAHTNGDRFYVTGAYRTVEYQTNLYSSYADEHGADMAAIYVANPGFSEHHTGYAVDLSSVNASGERVTIMAHPETVWINEHCCDYGFILRYPVGTQEITHVAYEPWHFRYIGRENAIAVHTLGFTYEEYIEHIKQYSVESGMLFVSDDGNIDVAFYNAESRSFSLQAGEELLHGSIIFYITASADEFTDIILPLGITSYEISGNNDGGFIITAKF